MSTSPCNVSSSCPVNDLTVLDYLSGCVNFNVPTDALRSLARLRNVDLSELVGKSSRRELELLRADLYVWIVLSPSVVGSSSDRDNGWQHQQGGYTLSYSDKRRFRLAANAIYRKYGEDDNVIRGAVIRLRSNGIFRGVRSDGGCVSSACDGLGFSPDV